MVIQYPNYCETPLLKCPKPLTIKCQKSNLPEKTLPRKTPQEVTIQTNPNRDSLVIRISETALRDLKQLRKVEVYLDPGEPVVKRCQKRPATENGLEVSTLNNLRDALMCNIYKAMHKAKMEEAKEDAKRKISEENLQDDRYTKKLKPEMLQEQTSPCLNSEHEALKSEELKTAKPVPYIVFIVTTLMLGFVYVYVNEPFKELNTTRGDIQDIPTTVPHPSSWPPVRIAQDILRSFPKNTEVLQDSHVFWRSNFQDPRVRILLRWISHTMWQRRRRRQQQENRVGELDSQNRDSIGGILENLVEDSSEALSVVEQNSWTSFRYPVEVTTVAWNILLEFVFYWLAE